MNCAHVSTLIKKPVFCKCKINFFFRKTSRSNCVRNTVEVHAILVISVNIHTMNLNEFHANQKVTLIYELLL